MNYQKRQWIPLFSRPLMSSLMFVAMSSSVIAQSEQRYPQTPEQETQQQQRSERQWQQQWPSESREYYSEEFQRSQQGQQEMSYDYEDGQFQRFQTEEHPPRFTRRPQRDFFEEESEFFQDEWSAAYEQDDEFWQPYQSRQKDWQQTGWQEQRISGCIDSLRTVRLAGIRQPHVLAEIEADDGRSITVDLGPRYKVAQLDVEEGDRITVYGKRGQVSQRPVILATRLQARGQTVSVERVRQEGLRRYEGEIVSTRIGFLRSHGHRHLLAKVRLEDGRVVTVDLGPQQELRQVSLRSGNQIQLLARPSRIMDERALIAEQFRSEGRLFEVEDLERRQRMQLRGQPIGEEFERQQWEQGQPWPRERQEDQSMSEYRPSGRLIEVTTRGYEFQPSQITVQPGQRIRIRLINRGATAHSIAFELPQGDARMQSPLSSGEVGTLELTAPQQPGTYTFYCPVANHRELGMEGRLVVQSPGQQQQSQQQQQPQERESQERQSQQQQPQY